jgi:cytochrome c553
MKRIALLALTLAAAPAFAETAGVPKAAATCFSCHGENGAKPIAPNYPVLAGQYANYLEHALTEYKEGKRKNPIMTAQAAQLSHDDIHELAHFFGAQQSPLHIPSVHGAAQK